MISIDNIYRKFEKDEELTPDEETHAIRTFLCSDRIPVAEKHKRLKQGFDRTAILDIVNRIISVRR